MYVKDYKYIKPTVDCKDYMAIDGLSRDCIPTDWFRSKIGQIKLTQATAVLYVGGFGISQSCSTDVTTVNNMFRGSIEPPKSKMVLKESTAYGLHKWIDSMMNNNLVVYANINNDTCASSMNAIYEANRILREGIVKEVIIIAEERTSFNTLRIFKEHRIPIVCGDGFAMIRLTANKNDGTKITDTKWKYTYNTNPFKTTKIGYDKIDYDGKVDYVKLHGTGTPDNEEAESTLIYDDRKEIRYKQEIGHTQGASALLEICMLLDDDNIKGKILCSAAGLGNFYGSCIVHK